MSRSRSLKEIAQSVRAELKKEFPDCKFSVRTQYASMCQELKVSLMASPESVYASLLSRPDKYDGSQHEINPGYNQLNHYYIEEDYNHEGQWYSNGVHLTEKGAKMLNRVVEIANQENWNNSDSMTDYFDVNYYFSLSIGQWDKPYQSKELPQTIEQVQTPIEVQEIAPETILEAVETTPEWLQQIVDNPPIIEEKVKTKRVRKATPKLTFSQRVKVAFRILKTGKV